jgi:5-methylthioadenosine/S-adenosylhomocysteine deaminase
MRRKIVNGIVIGWHAGRHQILRDSVVVFEGNTILHVGRDDGMHTEETIDASGHIVAPGYVNVHAHVTDSAYTKGFLEDQGQKDFSTLYRILPTVRHAVDGPAEVAAAECTFAELLLSGSTTVVELGFDYEMMNGADIGNAEAVAESASRVGIRCYMAPRFRSGYYGLDDSNRVFYRDYPNKGRDRLRDCVRFCREFCGKDDGLIRTMLAPGQVDTCDRELLIETRSIANELSIPIQIHAGQSPTEYRRIRETRRMSTIEYLHDTGLLKSDLLIGHGMWLAEDGDVGHLPDADRKILSDSGATIAHLPWVKARQSSIINSFEKYRRAGVRVALGTDTYPFDMFNEMRFCAIMCKVVESNPNSALAPDVYYAATAAGADALGRPDLGRVAAGCKADILLINVESPHAQPLRDPFKFLVLGAYGSDVTRVIVNGRTVVSDRQLLSIDLGAALARRKAADLRVRNRIDL